MSKTAPNLRRIDAAEMRRIKHMAGQGLTVGEIANHLGRQRSTIRAAADRAGIHIIRIRQRSSKGAQAVEVAKAAIKAWIESGGGEWENMDFTRIASARKSKAV